MAVACHERVFVGPCVGAPGCCLYPRPGWGVPCGEGATAAMARAARGSTKAATSLVALALH